MQADDNPQADAPRVRPRTDPEALRPADVRVAAMDLLARREHSLSELHRKLCRRFDAPDLVASVLEGLQRENLQSDERYAESLLRQRLQRGYGPARIRQDMRERGLDEAAIAAAYAAVEPDWFAAAESVFTRKFGATAAAESRLANLDREDNPEGAAAVREARQLALKERAKRMRFMQYRGFAAEHFRHLLDE